MSSLFDSSGVLIAVIVVVAITLILYFLDTIYKAYSSKNVHQPFQLEDIYKIDLNPIVKSKKKYEGEKENILKKHNHKKKREIDIKEVKDDGADGDESINNIDDLASYIPAEDLKPLKKKLLERTMAWVRITVELQKERPNIYGGFDKGYVTKNVYQRFRSDEDFLVGELKDILKEANAVRKGWGDDNEILNTSIAIIRTEKEKERQEEAKKAAEKMKKLQEKKKIKREKHEKLLEMQRKEREARKSEKVFQELMEKEGKSKAKK